MTVMRLRDFVGSYNTSDITIMINTGTDLLTCKLYKHRATSKLSIIGSTTQPSSEPASQDCHATLQTD